MVMMRLDVFARRVRDVGNFLGQELPHKIVLEGHDPAGIGDVAEFVRVHGDGLRLREGEE